jgi:hypothetical protein
MSNRTEGNVPLDVAPCVMYGEGVQLASCIAAIQPTSFNMSPKNPLSKRKVGATYLNTSTMPGSFELCCIECLMLIKAADNTTTTLFILYGVAFQ